MKCNETGLQIIKTFEGFRSSPYKCSAGVPTVGYGSTRGFDRRPIKMSMGSITEEQADDLLKRDISSAERSVSRLIKVELNGNEFSSLVSFVYNLGSGNLQSSTLRSKLNRDDREGASNEFPKWRKAGGKVLKGLVLRREAERNLFLM